MEYKEENAVILFPEYEALKAEVEKLRTELSMLLLERDELLYVECRNLEMQYMLTLGSLEYRIYEAQCEALRLRRKAELIQAKKNRSEPVFLSRIEALLDQEFSDYQKLLDEQIRKMNDAVRRSQEKILSEEETRELKKQYRRIIKALHPDLHPRLTQAQTELFYHAVEAYKNGDLRTMRMIGEMFSEPPSDTGSTSAAGQLLQDKKQLLSLLDEIKKDIQKIRSDYPCTMEELLRDPEKIKARKQELQELLRQYQEQIRHYSTKIQEMLR